MFRRFFVPLDGSSRAEKAIPVAATLARNSAGTVILARVVAPPIIDEYSTYAGNEAHFIQKQKSTEARIYLDEVMERYDQVLAGLHLIVEVVAGAEAISASILSLAKQEHTDLIVMCSRGDTHLKRWIFGSVAQTTMRHSSLPILALNDHGSSPAIENPVRPLQVLVALDGSEFSEEVLRPLCQLLLLFPTNGPHKLHLLQVVTLPPTFGNYRSGAYVTDVLQQDERKRALQYLQDVAHKISDWVGEKTTIAVTTQAVISPDVASVALEQAKETQCDLIALATHGRSGIKRALLGSVTEHIFGTTLLPLFVVCPPAMQAEQKSEQPEVPFNQAAPIEQGPVGLL
ncbi:MAG TPA: universal stress protein [Ktedonobacteraceae bacterium]|nr:universal stress protein [Ktedonobacteraceae bacterium]